jgi:acetyl-CoA carboxylase biotin carboxyl carrier protein
VPAATPVSTPAVAVAPPAEVQATDLVTVSAPTLGTFYCAARPDLPPYVQVGSVVDSESTVGLIEAMKVFTGVTAGVSGSVVEILVENGDFVEFGQPLFRVKPQASDSDSAQ